MAFFRFPFSYFNFENMIITNIILNIRRCYVPHIRYLHTADYKSFFCFLRDFHEFSVLLLKYTFTRLTRRSCCKERGKICCKERGKSCCKGFLKDLPLVFFFSIYIKMICSILLSLLRFVTLQITQFLIFQLTFDEQNAWVGFILTNSYINWVQKITWIMVYYICVFIYI